MSVVTELNQFYEDSFRVINPFLSRANRDLRAYSGDTWTQQELAFLRNERRTALTINKIRRAINLLTGVERENRKQIITKPNTEESIYQSDIWTRLLRQICMKNKFPNIWSNACEHTFKTGLSLVGIEQSYDRDRIHGDPQFYWKGCSSFIIDPTFTKRDLSDASRVAMRDMKTRDEIKTLVPWISGDEIDNLPSGISDRKYQYMGTSNNFNRGWSQRNLVTYDQYWVKDTRLQKQLFDGYTGMVTPLDHRTDDEIEDLMGALPGSYSIIDRYIPTVTLNIVAGNVLLYSGRDATKLDRYPFMPVIGYFEPLIDSYSLRIMGVCRDLVDINRNFNRRHSQIVDIFETSINTGLMWKNGALLDPEEAVKGGQGRQIVVDPAYDINNDVKELTPASASLGGGWLEYQQVLDSQIMEVAGLNEDLAGVSDGVSSQISGRLSQIRASNGIRSARTLFDNMEEAQMGFSSLLMEYFYQNWKPPKIAAVVGKEVPSDFHDFHYSNYYIDLGQGALTDTQRDAIFNTLKELKSIGVNIPDSQLIKYAPGDGTPELQEILAAQEQEASAIARQQAEDQHMLTELSASQVDHNTALAQEKRTRVLGDIAYSRSKISQAEADQVKSSLDAVKTLAEIEDLDKKNVQASLDIAERIRGQARQEEETVLKEDLQTRNQILNEEL